jgi:hypothetical protein
LNTSSTCIKVLLKVLCKKEKTTRFLLSMLRSKYVSYEIMKKTIRIQKRYILSENEPKIRKRAQLKILKKLIGTPNS